MYYCRRFYRGILNRYELGESNPSKINFLDVNNVAVSAWKFNCKKETITNCFQHNKFCSLRYHIKEFR